MNQVERIKQICKERKIPISRLERDLGYANAYFAQLKKGFLPPDRLSAVANYLGVSEDYLNSGEEDPSEFTARNETERRLLVLFRNTDEVPEDERREIVEHFEQTIDLYLKAKGLSK